MPPPTSKSSPMPYEAPPMYKKLHENVKSFYNIH